MYGTTLNGTETQFVVKCQNAEEFVNMALWNNSESELEIQDIILVCFQMNRKKQLLKIEGKKIWNMHILINECFIQCL